MLPEWTAKYNDVLTPDFRHELAVWRVSTGLPGDEQTMAGSGPHDDWEAAYHHNLTGRINARYGGAVKTWADRIVEYDSRPYEQTGELAKSLATLFREGIDASPVLGLAAARKLMPADHPTAALSLPREGSRHAEQMPSSPVHQTRSPDRASGSPAHR